MTFEFISLFTIRARLSPNPAFERDAAKARRPSTSRWVADL